MRRRKDPPGILSPAPWDLTSTEPPREARIAELQQRAADLAARAAWLEAQIKGITDTDMWQLGRVAALRIKAGRSQPGDAEVLADAFEALTRYIARLRGHGGHAVTDERKRSMRIRKAAVAVAVAALAGGGTVAVVATPGAHAAAPAPAAVCTTTSPTGGCGPYNDPAVFQGPNGADLVVQNDFSSIPQTLTASGPTAWTVAASTVGQSDQTSVKSYPATQVTYTLSNGKPEPSHCTDTSPQPCTDFGTTLTSDFTNVIPAGSGQDFEYAVDDWLADPAQNSWTNDFELMIWTYTNGQVPAGNDTGQVYTDAAGTQWEVWVAGGATTVSPDSTVSFVRKVNAVSGSLERWGFYHYLQAHGMLNANFGIDQTNYGLEICSTGGATRTYGISGYDLVKDGTGPTPTPTPTTPTPTPTPTTTSPTPTPTPTTTTPPATRTLTLGLTWRAVANTGHYVIKWTPSGSGTAAVFRTTSPALNATVTGQNGGEYDVYSALANGGSVTVSTNKIGV